MSHNAEPVVIRGGTVVTASEGGVRTFADHTIVLREGVIAEFGPDGAVDVPGPELSEWIDAGRSIVIPGLVNTHHHLLQSITRALPAAQDAELFDWLRALYVRWRHLDYESVRAAALVSLGELLLSGCTTTSDHFYLVPRGSDIRHEAVLEAADRLGIRIHLCRGSMSVGESKGGLPPDDCTEDEDAILRDSERMIGAWHDPCPLAMRRIDLAPCSPFNVSPELFRDTRDLARARGVLLHTHAAETMDEEGYCLEKFGCRPIPFFEDQGWLGPDVYLAHCVCLSDADIACLGRSRTGVAHCPCSNMRLGSGVAPIPALLAAGARIGIAVDGSSSNDGGNVLAEARQALLLQRAFGGAKAFRVAQAFELATVGGAAVLNRDRLGRIAIGMAADVAMFRMDDIALAGAAGLDPLGALILCHPPRADRVIVGGRTVVQDGRLVGADETVLARDLNARAQRLVSATES
jgi:cytosine/adenosine deaminase-related metal-dependent hydrolase